MIQLSNQPLNVENIEKSGFIKQNIKLNSLFSFKLLFIHYDFGLNFMKTFSKYSYEIIETVIVVIKVNSKKTTLL